MPIPALLAAAAPYLASAAPYLGAAAGGATLGGLLSRGQTGNVLLGQQGQERQFQRFTPQQQQLQNQAITQLMAGLQPGGQLDFGPIAQRARSQFSQQAIPTIAERFSALGQNALSSPALYSQLGGAAANLEEALAAQQGAFQQRNMLGLLGLASQPSFETAYMPRQRGLLEIGGSAALQLLPYLAMGGLGGLGGMAQAQDLSPAVTLSGLGQQAGGVGTTGIDQRVLGLAPNYF
jgi:hypothetical protein